MELEKREIVLCSAGAKGRSSSSCWDCRLPRRSSLFNRPLLIFPRHNHQHHERFCILLVFLCSLFLPSCSASWTGTLRRHVIDENVQANVFTIEECTETCKSEDEVCVASTRQQKGHNCILSTTRYVLAYSTGLRYETYG
ncbi:unnamed protein product [Calypogeia fissa]